MADYDVYITSAPVEITLSGAPGAPGVGSAGQIHAASATTTPADADELPLSKSSSWVLNKITFGSIKTWVKAFLGTAAQKDIPTPGNNASGDEVVLATDTRLTDTRTPSSTLAHAASHATGQSDAISPASISAATATHVHGSITTDGKVGADAGNILITGASGLVSAGTVGSGLTLDGSTLNVDAFALTLTPLSVGFTIAGGTTSKTLTVPLDATVSGTNTGDQTAGTGLSLSLGAFSVNYGTTSITACVGNDSRLSDNRTPTSHTHGNIQNDGKIGTTSDLPLITGTGGLVTVGAFGTGATNFCAGNDSRLSDERVASSVQAVVRTYAQGPPIGYSLSVSGTTTLSEVPFTMGLMLYSGEVNGKPSFANSDFSCDWNLSAEAWQIYDLRNSSEICFSANDDGDTPFGRDWSPVGLYAGTITTADGATVPEFVGQAYFVKSSNGLYYNQFNGIQITPYVIWEEYTPIDRLGTAAFTATTAYATAAKFVAGAGALTGPASSLTIGTAASNATGDFATATQGTNADAHRVDVDIYGFLNQTQTTLAFNPAGGTTPNNGLFTLGSVGASWSYYAKGIKYTVTGSKTVPVPDATATTQTYYIYIDNGVTDGTLTCSQVVWDLDGDGKVPVATITRNSGLTPAYLIGEERHTCKITRRDHMIEHYTGGAIYASGGVVTGQTNNSSTNTDKTCAVTAVKFFDEDIYETTAAIADGNASSETNYSVFYRTGATAWAWARSLVPFKYTTTGAIEFDSNGTMTAATAGNGASKRWVNYYLMACNLNGQESLIWIPGRAQFTTLALANAENFSTFDLTRLPTKDGVAIWRFTWHTDGAGLGLCQLAQNPVRISSNIVTSAVTTTTVHDALTGVNLAADGITYGHVSDQAQTIAGVKTFTSAPVFPAKTRHVFWPAGAAIPQSSTAPEASTIDSGDQDVFMDAFGFDSATSEQVQFVGYLEHWGAGTIKCRASWTYAGSPSPATNVQWGFAARAFADDDAHNQAFGTPQVISDACIAAGDCHVTDKTPAITVAGTPANGQRLQLKVYRDVANDDMAADAKLIGVWVEYTEATTEEAAW